jgi:hypothetical protein
MGLVLAGLLALTVLGLDPGGFSTEAWIAEGQKPYEEVDRGGMVVAAQERLRPGMTEAEVIALLGPPDGQGGGEMVYELGMAAYGVDFEQLVVVLDGAGRLVETRIRRG